MNRKKIKSAARYLLASVLICYGLFFAASGTEAQMTLLGTAGIIGLVVASDARKERAKCADRLTELESLIDKAVDDRPGKITNEQIDAEYTAVEAKIAELDKQIEDADKWANRKKVTAERNKRLSQSQGLVAPPNKSGEQDGELNGNQIETRDNILDDPNRGFKDHRDFLTAVIDVSMTGRLDSRLKPLISTSKNITAGSDEQGEYSQPYGGFFVPAGFSPTVLRIDPEGNPMAGLVTQIPMETPTVSLNARVDKNHATSVSGGLRVYWKKETQAVAASRMEHEQVELKANMLFGVAHASEEVLARSPVSFIALLQAGFSDEFNAKLIDSRLNGTGAGEFEGVNNSPCKITVTKESNQPAGTITKNNIDDMRVRCWRYGSSIWLANHGTLPMLRSLVQLIGSAGIAVPYFTTTPDGQAMLDGRPLFFSEFCAALGTEGDIGLYDWSQYLEGTLTTVQQAESVHVRFIEHERTLKFWTELDGRCWWRSALTPRNGPTRSPVVTLQTRS